MRVFDQDGIQTVAIDDLLDLWMSDQEGIQAIADSGDVDITQANLALCIVQSDACIVLLAAGRDVSEVFDPKMIEMSQKALDHHAGAIQIRDALDNEIPDDLSELLDPEWQGIMEATDPDDN